MGDTWRNGVEHISIVPLGVSEPGYLVINFYFLNMRISLEKLSGMSSLLITLLRTENALRQKATRKRKESIQETSASDLQERLKRAKWAERRRWVLQRRQR